MYDTIIVGARCAGSALGMLLAREGAKVLIVDRGAFPGDIPHGHFVHRSGPRRLRDWGLLDRVATATPPIRSATTYFGDFPLRSTDLVEDGLPWAYGPRRSTLDQILLDAAIEAGAEVRTQFNVDQYLSEEGRITGIRGRARDGRSVEERATITVGADGRNSRLASTVGAPSYNEVPPLLCYYFSYWSGVRADDFELHVLPEQRRGIFVHRTEDDLFAVFVGAPMSALPEIRGDIEGAFLGALDAAPGLGERVRAGTREERFYGATDLPNFYRKPFGPGWALVGDAGLHKDPWMALGISDAFRHAEFLAEGISSHLSGKESLEAALALYEWRRNEASGADYQENVALARFDPIPPEVLMIRAAVKDNPVESTRFMKARMQMIEPASFFNPEHLAQLRAGLPGKGIVEVQPI
jgi:flavin-dependent dehydrogenase